MIDKIWLWVGFNGFVLAILALDLGVFHRQAHTVSIKEAALWSVAWISLVLIFNAGIYFLWNKLYPGTGYTSQKLFALSENLPGSKIMRPLIRSTDELS